MSDPNPTVQVPLSLANALFECYYGAGPRYHERFVNGGMPPPTPMVREESIPLEAAPSLNLEGVPVRQWQPRGYEARKIMEEEKRTKKSPDSVGTITKPPQGV